MYAISILNICMRVMLYITCNGFFALPNLKMSLQRDRSECGGEMINCLSHYLIFIQLEIHMKQFAKEIFSELSNNPHTRVRLVQVS